jgi:transposase
MAGLVKGKTVGIDATTLEANAALRSIVRRDTGEGYEEFLTRLAKASGIITPTRGPRANRSAPRDRVRGRHAPGKKRQAHDLRRRFHLHEDERSAARQPQ